MNIYQLLEKDHKKINALLDRLVLSSESNQDNWKSLIEEIRDELIPHSRSEEAVFYNAIREVDPKTHVIQHSYAEHATAEADLRLLQTMKAIDLNWTRLAKKLRSDLLSHVENEESRVFAEGRKIFTDEEAKMIGNAFKELKPTVKSQSFLGTTIDLIANLLPRRLVPGFKKHVSEHHAEAIKKSA